MYTSKCYVSHRPACSICTEEPSKLTPAFHEVAQSPAVASKGAPPKVMHTAGLSTAVAWCRLTASSMHGLPETSNSMMNSMLTAMRSGISAVGRRMGVSLPQTLRKLLEGITNLECLGPGGDCQCNSCIAASGSQCTAFSISIHASAVCFGSAVDMYWFSACTEAHDGAGCIHLRCA